MLVVVGGPQLKRWSRPVRQGLVVAKLTRSEADPPRPICALGWTQVPQKMSSCAAPPDCSVHASPAALLPMLTAPAPPALAVPKTYASGGGFVHDASNEARMAKAVVSRA